MKAVQLTTAFLFFALTSMAQNQADEKEKAKVDSIAKTKKDSTQIANSSPMRVNNSAAKKTELNLPPAKRQRSQYLYDRDGRLIGGSTTVLETKPKKKKKN
ncbi:MAG: hypothetical protein MUF68_00495 [Cyclobacteriaceae bacterium]|jgi:high-affinity K+ transport system ATPase subunit B|nr:hypothetical protein [Cyclobacteriaceae bacterium]